MTEHEATTETDSDPRAADGGPTDDGGPDVPPSVRIVEAVAAETGRDPTDLPPLHDYVDSDAIDALLGDGASDDADLHLQFSYAGVEVTVHGDGVIEVEG